MYPAGGAVYKDDIAAIQTERLVTEWFNEDESKVLPCPAQSPNLKSIEQL